MVNKFNYRLLKLIKFKPFYFQDQNAGKLFADEASSIYERSITSLLKENMLIYFAYADFEEVNIYQDINTGSEFLIFCLLCKINTILPFFLT